MIVVLLAHWVGTVSFENPGIRLELFLKEISKQSGSTFRCTQSLNDEVLAASFHDQSIEIVKTQLERVMHGTWEKKDAAWWLVQSAKQKREEEQWALENRNVVLKSQLDGLSAVAPKSEWTIQDAEKYWRDYTNYRSGKSEGPRNSSVWRKIRLSSPESRFCAGIASLLTAQMFNIDPVKFNVARYSVRGLPGHVELPIDPSVPTKQYIAERGLYSMVSQVSDNADTPTHIELRYEGGERPYIFFSWLNKDWKYVGRALPSAYIASPLKPQGEVFPLSDSTKRALELRNELSSVPNFAETFEKNKTDPVMADAVATMFEATKRDPLGIIEGRCWIDFSRSVGKPLLVNLKEEDLRNSPSLSVPTIDQPGPVVGMTRIDADGWVLGRPMSPLFNRTWRLERSIIEEYARLAKTETTSSWYGHLRRSFISTYESFGKSGIPENEFLLDMSRDYGGLSAILGAAPEGILTACLNGSRIPLSQLPQISQDLAKYSLDEGELNELSPINLTDAGQYCPLAVMPNGLRGITIGATLGTEPEFLFEKPPVEDYGEKIDLSTMAYLLSESKSDSPIQNLPFKLATKQVLNTTLYLGSKSKTNTVAEPAPETDLPTYTWKNLPDAIRQQVLVEMKKYVK